MTTTPEELLSQAREALKPCPHCGLLHTLKLTTAQELAEEGEDDPEPWMHSDSWAVICDMSRPNGPGGCGASGGFYPSEAEAIEAWNRRAAIDAHLKQPSAPSGEPADKWEGAEEWMPLAWELCADECGEDACTELVWEGGPVPEPWGDRWLKYEDEAKRLIALVRKHVPAPQAAPAPQPSAPADALALLQQAHAALRYHTEQTRPIANTVGTMALIHDYLTVQAEHAPTTQPLSDALARLLPTLEARMRGLVFTADKAGQVAADMNTIRAAAGINATTAKGQQ